MAKETYEIRSGSGCGGFLNPPSHPAHTHAVIGKCGREETSFSSIEHTAGCDWIPVDIRAECKRMLDTWEASKPSIAAPETRDWIGTVLAYFKGCYRNPNVEGVRQWYASDLLIRDWTPMDHADDHAGVRCIRQYYPDYVPVANDFTRGKWGA